MNALPGCDLSMLEAIHLKVVEASPDTNIVCDITGKVVIFNSQAECMFGYSREEVIGQPVEFLLPDGIRERHAKFFQGYIDDPRTREMGNGGILKAQHRSGKQFMVQIKLAPIIVARGGLHVLAVVRRVWEKAVQE